MTGTQRRRAGTCPTGKLRLRDHKEAIALLHRCQAAHALGNPRRRERRAYFCDACKGWHLTSQPNWHEAAA